MTNLPDKLKIGNVKMRGVCEIKVEEKINICTLSQNNMGKDFQDYR